ncbi:hypothetical protein H0H81_011457, partial [Sphagnurus paluster]
WEEPSMSARIAQFVDISTPQLARNIKYLCIFNYVEDYIDDVDSDDQDETIQAAVL